MVALPILWTCGFVAAAVFAVMIHSVATFRRSGQRSALVEILWAIVPIFIMVTSALPAVKMLASQHSATAVQASNDP
jgi:heme/copper-type cytochrome/quinol oxidase subunit 2